MALAVGIACCTFDKICRKGRGKGWHSARLLVDREAGKTVIIGLWETEADARASGNMGSAHVQSQPGRTASGGDGVL